MSSWPFRTVMERNSDDGQANANEPCAALRWRLQARKQILMQSFFEDYQIPVTSEISLRIGLSEVSENSLVQGARPDTIIRVGGDEDSWDRLAPVD
jgi:hypothetical protein